MDQELDASRSNPNQIKAILIQNRYIDTPSYRE